ncbi:hypothetical protein [Massilia violaceinigra]
MSASAGRMAALLPGYHLPDIDVLAVYPSRRHMIDFLAAELRAMAPWDKN